MSKQAIRQMTLLLFPIDADARDGGYKIVASDDRFALARWNGECFAYPGNTAIEFAPKYYRCAKRVVAPDEVAGHG